MLEDENFVEASVYLQPPANGVDSNEDSDGEDGGSANHLSSQQLTAPAEYIINYGNNVINTLEASEDNMVDGGDNTEASESEMEGKGNATVIQHSGLCAHPPPDVGNKWLKAADLQPKQFLGSPEQRCMTQPLTPLGLFNAFFDDEIVNNMVQMTNLYAKLNIGFQLMSVR